MTSVECMHCGRHVGNLAGLSAHVRSMHPDKVGNQPPAEPAAAPANGLVWEDPPPKGNGPHARAEILALIPELRRNPGRWARLRSYTKKSSANSAKTSLSQLDTLTDIELVARSDTKAGTSALYGRYTGE